MTTITSMATTPTDQKPAAAANCELAWCRCGRTVYWCNCPRPLPARAES